MTRGRGRRGVLQHIAQHGDKYESAGEMRQFELARLSRWRRALSLGRATLLVCSVLQAIVLSLQARAWVDTPTWGVIAWFARVARAIVSPLELVAFTPTGLRVGRWAVGAAMFAGSVPLFWQMAAFRANRLGLKVRGRAVPELPVWLRHLLDDTLTAPFVVVNVIAFAQATHLPFLAADDVGAGQIWLVSGLFVLVAARAFSRIEVAPDARTGDLVLPAQMRVTAAVRRAAPRARAAAVR